MASPIARAIFYLHRGQTVVFDVAKFGTVLRGINAVNEELTRTDRGRVSWTSICQSEIIRIRGISHNVLHVEINHEAYCKEKDKYIPVPTRAKAVDQVCAVAYYRRLQTCNLIVNRAHRKFPTEQVGLYRFQRFTRIIRGSPRAVASVLLIKSRPYGRSRRTDPDSSNFTSRK